MEMGATKVWGEVGRWLVIALIQLAKYVGTVEGWPGVGVTDGRIAAPQCAPAPQGQQTKLGKAP